MNHTDVLDFYHEEAGDTNVLGLVTFSLAFGIVIGLVGENALILKKFFCALHETILYLVSAVIWYDHHLYLKMYLMYIFYHYKGIIINYTLPLPPLHTVTDFR